MNYEKAAKLLFRCPMCQGHMEKINTVYGCTAGDCFNNATQVKYRKLLKKLSKRPRR